MARDHPDRAGPRPTWPPSVGAGPPISPVLAARWFQALYETPLLFSGILDRAGRVLDANYLSIEGCGLDRDAVLGRPFWEGGWWSPDPVLSDQVRRWCERALLTGQPFRTRGRYFLGDGTPRMVDLALSPVWEDDGGVTHLIATGSDVTDTVAAQQEREDRMVVEADELRGMAEDRRRELLIVQEAERLADTRLQRLVGVALDLVGVETVEDLTDIIVNRGLPVLGADGGAVRFIDADGVMQLAASRGLKDDVQVTFGAVTGDSPMPTGHVARTGQRLVLPTRAAGLEFTPLMAGVYEATDRGAWVFEPLKLGSRVLGCLAVSWVREREFSPDELGLIEAFAAQCAQVLERVRITQAQRVTAAQIQRLAVALQRSLLTTPPTPVALDIAVRYLPAAQEAQIGGDWYDGFDTTEGTTLISVGDVSGHDGDAAAGMAQLRNLLRGLAVHGSDGPAVLLTRLDQAIERLGLDTLATALLARVEIAPDDRPAGDSRSGARRLRWSSAGHLPPLLRLPDGEVRVLAHDADLLLGLDSRTPRAEHVTDLPAGCTLLLYTDGLVERRGEHIDDGVRRLARALGSARSASSDEVCDHLLAAMLTDAPEDDVALLVLRLREMGPRATPAPGPGNPGMPIS